MTRWVLDAAQAWAADHLHVSMVTCPTREFRANRTLDRLTLCGVMSISVHKNDLPLGHDNLVLNFGSAIQGFLESKKPWWLACEDDIIPRKDLLNHVALGTQQNEDIVVYCVIGKTCVPDALWQNHVLLARRFERHEFHALPRLERFFGSQCVLINRKAAILIEGMKLLGVEKPSGGHYYFDDLIARYGYKGEGICGYFPNIVQHIGGRKTWSKCPSPTAVSSTYPLQPRDQDA